MFLLHLIPDAFILWVTNIVLLLGVALTVVSFFIKFIPLVNQYKLPLQILGIILLVAGVYFKGGYSVEMEWRAKVAEVEEKLKEAEDKSQKVNTVIVEKVVKKIEIITRRGEDIIKYVDREIVKYDNICPVPPPVVKAHNAAAENKAVKESK